MRAERLAATTCLVLALAVGINAELLVSESTFARAGVFPAHGALWIGAGVLGVASAAWLGQTFRRNRPERAEHTAALPEVVVVFAILLAGAVSARWLGLLVAAALCYIVLLFYYRDRSKIFVVVSAAAYVVVLHVGMEVLLRVPLAGSPFFDLPF